MLHPVVASLHPNSEQLPAITHRGSDLVVTAGAGSGKTRTLVGRYLSLLAGGLTPRQIAAITFTRKAAHEMRNRVRQSIEAYTRHADSEERLQWRTTYEALDAARIGTIHSLCSEILRAHPAEAAIDPRFTLLEEAETILLRGDIIDAALARAAAHAGSAQLFSLLGERRLRRLVESSLKDRPAFKAALSNIPDDLLGHWGDCLRESQTAHLKEAVQEPVFVNAVRSLRENEPMDANDLLALQRSAALAAVGALEQAVSWEQKRDALREIGAINLRGGRQNCWPAGKEQQSEVRDALKALRDWQREHAKVCDLELNESDEAFAAALPGLRQILMHAHTAYEQSLTARRALDFDDLELRALQLLRENIDVRAYWQNDIQAMLVDEYQDTNARQRDLLNLINGDQGKLFIVGDAKQSIYRFRGAEIAVFRQERDRIARQGRALTLSHSYRAHTQLVAGLNALLGPILGDSGATKHPWQEPFAPLIATRAEAQFALEPPYIEMHLTCGSKSDGALTVAARMLASRLLEMRAATNGALAFSDIAILCQASSSFSYYEDALAAASIPYITVAGRGFYDRPEIRDLLNMLQAVADPLDDLALVGFLRSPVSGFDDSEILTLVDLHRQMENVALWYTLEQAQAAVADERLQRTVALIAALHGQVGRRTIAEILKALLDETGYRAALRLAGRIRALRNVDKLLEIAYSSALISSADFLEYISQLRSGIAREGEARITGENAVQIMSVHQAKGLEFPIVVIGDITYSPPAREDHFVDVALGLVVKVSANDEQQPAAFALAKTIEDLQQDTESARLLYVAATRAREKLILNGCTAVPRSGRFGSQRGWLQLIGRVSGMSEVALDYDAEGSRRHSLDLALAQHIACHIYEPHHTPPLTRLTAAPAPATTSSLPTHLLSPVGAGAAPEELSDAAHVWQVVPDGSPQAIPAPLLGNLVHESLRLWRFPTSFEDEAFTRSMRIRFRRLGVVDAARLEEATRTAMTLLLRLRAHPLYERISGAQRRFHELPFTRHHENGEGLAAPDHAGPEVGRIDLLYLDNTGWHIVDFKTEPIESRGQLANRLQTLYRPQLATYRRAVQALLNVTPSCSICVLDYQGEVILVDPDRWQA